MDRRAPPRAPSRPRPLARVAAGGGAALAVRSAFGLYRDVIDFLTAEPAPERIVVDFGRMSARATVGFGPRVIRGEARVVLTAQLRGKTALYVAPTREGGCAGVGRAAAAVVDCGTAAPRPWVESAQGAAQLSGHLLNAAIERLKLCGYGR